MPPEITLFTNYYRRRGPYEFIVKSSDIDLVNKIKEVTIKTDTGVNVFHNLTVSQASTGGTDIPYVFILRGEIDPGYHHPHPLDREILIDVIQVTITTTAGSTSSAFNLQANVITDS
jgi:hypothetical protein